MVGGILGVATGGTLSNCFKRGGNVTGTKRQSDNAGFIGGLIGIFNPKSAADVGTLMTNCYNTVNVSSTGADVGGLLGCSGDCWAPINKMCYINNCYSVGNVSGSEFVGALIGHGYYTTVNKCGYKGGNTLGKNYSNVNMTNLVIMTESNSSTSLPILGNSFVTSFNETIQKYPQLYWEKDLEF